MTTAKMPDKFYEELEPLLPEQPAIGRRGGRPPIPNRIVVNVIWFVLVTGSRLADVPLEMGCSGRTGHRQLEAWELFGVSGQRHLRLLERQRQSHKLNHSVVIVDGTIVPAFGGSEQLVRAP
jgi:transposase